MVVRIKFQFRRLRCSEFEKQFGGVAIPRKNDPVGEGFDLSLEFCVADNLAVRIVMPAQFGQPAAQQFLDGHDGYNLGRAVRFEPPDKTLAGG